MSEKTYFAIAGILFGPALILMVGFLAVSPFWLAYQYFYPPASITLEAKIWDCSGTYKERVYTGKVWTTVTKCSRYERKE